VSGVVANAFTMVVYLGVGVAGVACAASPLLQLLVLRSVVVGVAALVVVMTVC
jgi:multisubunit Na+/H+ antiporter MnhC subunit